LEVNFEGEEGVDAGGVLREWYFNLSRAMMNPGYGLFHQSNIGSETYQPNSHSGTANPDHLQYFKFCGRIVAKALIDGQFLDCHFTRAFYKQILGVPVSWRDLQAVDEPLYKSLLWLLENDISVMEVEKNGCDYSHCRASILSRSTTIVSGRSSTSTSRCPPWVGILTL
jgi:E3 ubiquitin-protein ligase HUWE1